MVNNGLPTQKQIVCLTCVKKKKKSESGKLEKDYGQCHIINDIQI